MSRLTSRHQIKTGDPRQLYRPDQLSEGMHVAQVHVLEGTRLTERLAKVGMAVTGLVDNPEGKSKLTVMRTAWKHEDLAGMLPGWSGVIRWTNENGIMVRMTGEPEDSRRYAELLATDPADLPELEEPCDLFDTYANLGLAAIGSIGAVYRTGSLAEDAGRWNRTALLELE